jgi:hypothetical protein
MLKLRSLIVAVVVLSATGCLARIGGHGGPEMRRDDDRRQNDDGKGHDRGDGRQRGGDDRGSERGRD